MNVITLESICHEVCANETDVCTIGTLATLQGHTPLSPGAIA